MTASSETEVDRVGEVMQKKQTSFPTVNDSPGKEYG